jgi:hypothetical protein
VLPNLRLERWETPIQIALLLGFPLSLILAWTFEVSRDGVRRTGTYEVAVREGRRWPLFSRRAVLAVVVILLLYLVFQVLL